MTSWCLCPVSSHLEVLVLPRERWRAALGLSRGALQRCEQLVAEKAEFFRERVLMAQRALHANMPAEPEVTSLLRKPELPSRLRKKRWMSKPKQADPAPLPKGGWAPHLDHSWDPSDPFASAPKAPTRLTKDPFAEFKKMDAAAAAAPSGRSRHGQTSNESQQRLTRQLRPPPPFHRRAARATTIRIAADHAPHVRRQREKCNSPALEGSSGLPTSAVTRSRTFRGGARAQPHNAQRLPTARLARRVLSRPPHARRARQRSFDRLQRAPL